MLLLALEFVPLNAAMNMSRSEDCSVQCDSTVPHQSISAHIIDMFFLGFLTQYIPIPIGGKKLKGCVHQVASFFSLGPKSVSPL